MRKMLTGRRILVSILALLLITIAQPVQPLDLKDIVKDASDKIPSLDSFMKEKPAITTKLADAVTEVPFLDDFNPKEMSYMTTLPRGSSGQFKLVRPGIFKFTSQSYCLHAGTYAPTKGDGYLYAPLAGPRAPIVKAVLARTWDKPEIPQRDIQSLIWAILAHTKIDDMKGEMHTLAYNILTKDEIKDLNGGALGMVPDKLLNKAKAELSPAASRVFEAESNLRSMFSTSGTTYGELERVAVLTGVPELGKDSREIPKGRWSYHSDGYFVRYFPSGYPTTKIEISVPDKFQIARDSKGRIVSIVDIQGNRIETTYDDAINPVSVSGDSGVKGYAFKSIAYTHRLTFHPEHAFSQTNEWLNTGWTLTGSPNGNGQIASASHPYINAQKRYELADNHKKELVKLINNAVKQKGKTAPQDSESSINDAVDLANFLSGIKEAIGEIKNDDEWTVSPVEFIQRAWQYPVCVASGAKPVNGTKGTSAEWGDFQEQHILIAALWGPDRPVSDITPEYYLSGLADFRMVAGGSDGGGDDDGGGGSSFDPCDNVANPGNTSSQRLKPSGREGDDPNKNDEPCEKANGALDNALRWLEAYSDPDILENADDAADYVDDVNNSAVEKASSEAGKKVESYTDASVGSDCQLRINGKPATFDQFRAVLQAGCPACPPEVIDAIVAHERTHMKQCMNDDNFNKPGTTKEDVSKYEREAYCTEAQMIMDYINDECGGVSPEQQAKFDALCG